MAFDTASMTSWETGDLSSKLRQVQRKMKQAMRDARALKYVFHCSRRLGKTFLLVADALEIGLTENNVRLPFAAPTQKQMKTIILPIFREITQDCPPALKPIWKASDQKFIFPRTSAELPIAGCSGGHEENLRGSAARKAYVDEAQAFKGNLQYVVQDILMPQLLTTNGSMVIAGTSPKTPVHDFVKIIQEAHGRGNYLTLPIWEAGYSKDLVEKFMDEAGGAKSTTWRREYLCEIVVDEASAIIPEWRPEFEVVPVRDQFFPFYHKYEAMDIGGRRDRTGTLFAWYDFQRAKLCIDAEEGVAPADMTTKRIADGIRKKEVDIFGKHPLKLRVADSNNEILLKDLGSMHGLHFVATNKETIEAMVNQVRLWAAAGKIEVNPACTELIGCLRYAIWNEKRKEFERFPEESDAHKVYGHFDMLAALVYLVRNVNSHENPIPHDFSMKTGTHFIPPPPPEPVAEAVTQMFRPRFRR